MIRIGEPIHPKLRVKDKKVFIKEYKQQGFTTMSDYVQYCLAIGRRYAIENNGRT